MIWFTADEHVDHHHIIRYMDRPFDNVDDMTTHLVEQHNTLVQKGDRVYHLGDVSFKPESSRKYIDRLNGQHFLIRGNHDPKKQTANWCWVGDTKRVVYSEDSIIFWLSHYAHLTWPHSHRGSFNLFGHSHGMLPDTGYRQMDVGVDANSFKPFSAEDIYQRLKTREYVNRHP